MATGIKTRINIGFALAALLLAAVGALSYRSSIVQRQNALVVLHTQRILAEVEGVAESVNQAETLQRGFVITGEERFIQQYDAAVLEARRRLQVLGQMIADSTARALLEVSAELTSRKIAEMNGTISVRRQQGQEAAAALVGGHGQMLAERLRAALALITQRQLRLLDDRTRRWVRSADTTLVVIVAGAVIGLIVVGFAAVSINRELAARQRAEVERLAAERALQASYRQNELILTSAAEGIYGVSSDDTISFVNPAAAAMCGYTAEELAGANSHPLIHHSRADGSPYPLETSPIYQCVRDGQSRRVIQEVFWRKDGSSFAAEYDVNPIREGDEVTGAVVTFRDVTARLEVERAKDEFVSVVSHELRTPLTSIRGSLGLLASGQLGSVDARGQRMLEIAVQNTDRLIRLINDILDIERMESGASAMEIVAVDAEDLMTQAVEAMRGFADKSEVSLSAAPFHGKVCADSDRILQVLSNLIGNAVKFSPAGSVVRLSAERRGQDVVFHVSDTGRGIPAQNLESIFERFQQVDSSDARGKGGTGLGLVISRSIVLQHGGQIWVESSLGEGSTFSFSIPEVRERKTDEDFTVAPPESPDRFALLLAEDDMDLATVLLEIFRQRGIRAYHATSGRETIDLAERLLPVLVVLDLGLPERDGFAVVDEFRRHDRLRDVALVVYSAREVSLSDRERLRLGPSVFLTKSRVTPEEFELKVVAMLDAIRSEPAETSS